MGFSRRDFVVRGVTLCGVLLGSAIGAASSFGAVHAEPAAVSAKQVADAVQGFYDQTKSVEADFHQTYFNRLYSRYDRSSGKVRFEKPGKMRWDYGKPNGKVLVSDGKRLTVFEPGEGSEPGQMFEQQMSESQLPQALAFLTGTGRLEEDFAFRLLDAKKQGFSGGFVLELRPKAVSPHYDRILFYVDSDPSRAGLVHRVLIVDPDGNRNRFDFRGMRFNRSAAAGFFAFKAPAGTRRVTP